MTFNLKDLAKGLLLYAILIVLMYYWFDVNLTHFEDGAGMISYCIPWEYCAEDMQRIVPAPPGFEF